MKTLSRCFLAIVILLPISLLAQNAERDAAMTAFKAADYARSAKLFKNVVKKNESDSEGWCLLGISYLQLNKLKDAAAALRKATDLEPQSANYWAKLAYIQFTNGDRYDPEVSARKAIELDPANPEAYFVQGAVAFKEGSFKAAYDLANRAITLGPDYAVAYLLKSEALVGSFGSLVGKVLAPGMPTDLLPEAAESYEKYIALSPALALDSDAQTRLHDLKWFAQYYRDPANRIVLDASEPPPDEPDKTGIKILTKPRPGYTDSARSRNISGKVILLAAFEPTGKIGPLLVIRSLDRGLDAQAIRAARGIRFTPATKNGVPVAVVKHIEYNFQVY